MENHYSIPYLLSCGDGFCGMDLGEPVSSDQSNDEFMATPDRDDMENEAPPF